MKKQHPKTKNDVQYMLESLSRGTILPLRYLRRLCERVNLILFRQKMFYVNSQMLFKCPLLSEFVEIFMANSQTCFSFSNLEAILPTTNTYS